MGIFYRADRVRLVEQGEFWLSDTPDQTGSESWGVDLPRMATWGLFELRGGRRFLFESARGGYTQLYLCGRDGGLIHKVTSAPWAVLGIYGVDEETGTDYFPAAAHGAPPPGPIPRPNLAPHPAPKASATPAPTGRRSL